MATTAPPQPVPPTENLTSTPSTQSLPPAEALSHPTQVPAFTSLMALAFFSSPSGPNPLSTAFTTEISATPPPYPSPSITASRFTSHFLPGIASAFEAGASLLCSPSVASPSALAVWEPPNFTGETFDQSNKTPGPILQEWQMHTARMRETYVGDRLFWHLGFLGRNPDPKSRVEGAVSAVVVPILERCRNEGSVAWLEATSESAVRIYEHYGFRACEVVRIGVGRVSEMGWPEVGGRGERAWGMIFDGRLGGE